MCLSKQMVGIYLARTLIADIEKVKFSYWSLKRAELTPVLQDQVSSDVPSSSSSSLPWYLKHDILFVDWKHAAVLKGEATSGLCVCLGLCVEAPPQAASVNVFEPVWPLTCRLYHSVPPSLSSSSSELRSFSAAVWGSLVPHLHHSADCLWSSHRVTDEDEFGPGQTLWFVPGHVVTCFIQPLLTLDFWALKVFVWIKISVLLSLKCSAFGFCFKGFYFEGTFNKSEFLPFYICQNKSLFWVYLYWSVVNWRRLMDWSDWFLLNLESKK